MVVLAQDITTEELIKTDYHYSYSDVELRKDWKRTETGALESEVPYQIPRKVTNLV